MDMKENDNIGDDFFFGDEEMDAADQARSDIEGEFGKDEFVPLGDFENTKNFIKSVNTSKEDDVKKTKAALKWKKGWADDNEKEADRAVSDLKKGLGLDESIMKTLGFATHGATMKAHEILKSWLGNDVSDIQATKSGRFKVTIPTSKYHEAIEKLSNQAIKVVPINPISESYNIKDIMNEFRRTEERFLRLEASLYGQKQDFPSINPFPKERDGVVRMKEEGLPKDGPDLMPDFLIDTFIKRIKERMKGRRNYEKDLKWATKVNGGKLPEKIKTLVEKDVKCSWCGHEFPSIRKASDHPTICVWEDICPECGKNPHQASFSGF